MIPRTVRTSFLFKLPLVVMGYSLRELKRKRRPGAPNVLPPGHTQAGRCPLNTPLDHPLPSHPHVGCWLQFLLDSPLHGDLVAGPLATAS